MPEFVIHDSLQPCPYLDGRTARMPLRLPTSRLTAEQLDDRLEHGDRRSGLFLYRTSCPACRACEPIRIPVDRFVPTRTQRRVWNRGNREIDVQLGPPAVDPDRVELFNAHRQQRGLCGQEREIDLDGYQAFLVDSCCDSVEISYRFGNQLMAVAICDRGHQSVSAVYCYFDPAFSQFSPGTYSILKQIDLCRGWSKRYLYLGLYISQSPHMSYKANFFPHERLIDRRWRSFDRRSMHESATIRCPASQVGSKA